MKVAINGFGRIGRNVFKIGFEKGNIEFVAINDLTDAKTLAHLLKYDSSYGVYGYPVEVSGNSIVINGQTIPVYAERDPKKLPWKELGIDVVIESTGIFRKANSDKGGFLDHIKAGAKKVILTVPSSSPEELTTVVLGVNEDQITADQQAYSNASCTTNCLAPMAKVLHEKFGIIQGLMMTAHAFTNDQVVLDAPHSDLRRARTAASNMIPTSTGAAKAVGLVLPELAGKLNGYALRVPIPVGSILDLTVELENKDVTAAMINKAMQEAAADQMKGILEYTEDPIVSHDIVGNPHSSIFDAGLTMVLEKGFAKVASWYDNEWGYSNRVVELITKIMA